MATYAGYKKKRKRREIRRAKFAKLACGLARLASCLVPVKSRRKKIRNFLTDKAKHVVTRIGNSHWGEIYAPYYPEIDFSGEELEVYNKDGRKMDVFFIRDRIGAHCPYRDASKYFLWDRYNIGLDTHFYTHAAMLETMGNPVRRYGYFIESEAIIPDEYKIFDKYKGIEKDFDAIFTYSENLLDKLDNAVLFPSCAGVYYGREYFRGVKDPAELDANLYEKKTRGISMLCSEKKSTRMHEIRHRIAKDALNSGKIDVFGGGGGEP